MRTAFFRSSDNRTIALDDDEAIRNALKDGDGVLWVDLDQPSRDEGEILSSIFGFHQLAIDDCFNLHIDPAKVDDYDSYLFIIAQAIQYEPLAEEVSTTELDMFVGPNYVVSFHQEPLRFVEDMRHRCAAEGPVLNRGADFLAHELLDGLVDDYQPAVEQLDETLSQVETLVLARPEPPILQDILTLKRNVQRLRRMIIPQRDVVNRLARGEFPNVVRPETYIYFRDVYDHVVRVEQLVESVRDLAEGVLNTYLGAVNNRMNEVMKTLAAVASVLLPLTFVASIYGMNFQNMPELEWEWGYYGVLGVMALIAASLVVFFRLRRWF